MAIFEKHWNQFVSPGTAVYGLRGDGVTILQDALDQGQTPAGNVHEKEVFF